MRHLFSLRLVTLSENGRLKNHPGKCLLKELRIRLHWTSAVALLANSFTQFTVPVDLTSWLEDFTNLYNLTHLAVSEISC